MTNELEPGCLAIIIQSVDGKSVGKIVQCISKIIELHYMYGVVWKVHSREPLTTEYGGVGNTVDVPAIWLRKIKPGELDKKTEKKLELTH